jgi:hypothetical protein
LAGVPVCFPVWPALYSGEMFPFSIAADAVIAAMLQFDKQCSRAAGE